MIGAVVGVQPFGGHGLSGTGPKAGGPLYLGRLVTGPAIMVAEARPIGGALGDFAQWLDGQGETEAAEAARRYGEQSATGEVLALLGPVGEENRYGLHPRGTVLLKPATKAGLFDQLAVVLATGNGAVIEAPLELADALKGVPASVAARIAAERPAAVAGALVEGDAGEVSATLTMLAEAPGPLVLTQSAARGARGTYRPDWLVLEVAVSTNTTASGGNATLMAIA
jgi:RHH-type proline utilization regulon transcriptional repressor/proline dehydrogenase/delta 1-pyrroline-5-carboxylate dehydrogenase